jgi:hypothetical protein
MIFDLTVMYKRTCGWMYESFLLFRSIRSQTSFSSFDFASDVETLLDLSRDDRHFSFHFIKNSTSESLSFFRLFPTLGSADSFRRIIGSLGSDHQHVLLCFLSSQMRWTITTPSSISHCPLCHKNAWLWEHFFSCPVILPALRCRSVDITSFKQAAMESRWKEVWYGFFLLVVNVRVSSRSSISMR